MNFQPPDNDDPRDDEQRLIDGLRAAFEKDAAPMGFSLRRLQLSSPEPWSEYESQETGHRWGGWLAHALAPGLSGWQEIASAPKDGTVVLVYSRGKATALKEAGKVEAVADEAVAEFLGRRRTPEGTTEFWGVMLCDPMQDPPKGSKLYLRPSQQALGEDAKDAARYRWLRNFYVPADGRDDSGWDAMDEAVLVGGKVLDAAIDSAILAAAGGSQ